VLPAPRALLQPIAAAEVARYVAGLAEQPPPRERAVVAGPEVSELRTLARTWRSATGRGLALLPVYMPGQVGRVAHGADEVGRWLLGFIRHPPTLVRMATVNGPLAWSCAMAAGC
jgi:uncharacterized protein YbjT (DUF2867 family)